MTMQEFIKWCGDQALPIECERRNAPGRRWHEFSVYLAREPGREPFITVKRGHESVVSFYKLTLERVDLGMRLDEVPYGQLQSRLIAAKVVQSVTRDVR